MADLGKGSGGAPTPHPLVQLGKAKERNSEIAISVVLSFIKVLENDRLSFTKGNANTREVGHDSKGPVTRLGYEHKLRTRIRFILMRLQPRSISK